MVSSVQNLSLWVLVALLAVFLWELRRLRVARDAVRAANAAKSEFASNISHELRTPLNGIVGAIELLAETNLDAKQCELAAIVRSSSESLLALIDSVLDFARIEAGQVRLERLKFDLRECVGSSVELLRQKADAKGLATEVRIADTVPAFVVGDPVRLRQVLLHLGNNAVKFTESGEVRLEVALAGEASSSNALWFRVVDSGIGIRPEAAARLFDPFTQAESGSARRYGGSGLGLATARRLVQLMEGSMGVESQIGQGSTFWFLLPLEIAAADDLPEPVPSVKGSVLIVDDNPVNRLVTVGAVRRLGYQAEVADSGKGALEACERRPFDAILLDCQMPVMDGYQTAAAIRRLQNGTGRVPIIAMTANAVEGDQEKCLACGMDDYLSKPIRMAILEAALSRWTGLPKLAGPARCQPPVPPASPFLFENAPYD